VAAEPEDPFQVVDATRRTRLAAERTLLAWWRSGLTAFAVALATGKLLPELTTGGPSWLYATLGVGYAVLGVVMSVYGTVRHREVETSLARGQYPAPERAVIIAFTATFVVLGVATAVIAIVDS
jgi:inner membrane protein YidH